MRQVFLEKWVRQSDELHHGMTPPNTTDWYLTENEQRGCVLPPPRHLLFIHLVFPLPCLFSVRFSVDTENPIRACLSDKKTMIKLWKKNTSWRHIGRFNYINLIRRKFQNIITVKYCASPLPQTFIILNLWILMRTSVKTGSVRPYFQGNRGHSYLLHQYPCWQVAQNISAFCTSGFMDQMFSSSSPKTSFLPSGAWGTEEQLRLEASFKVCTHIFPSIKSTSWYNGLI